MEEEPSQNPAIRIELLLLLLLATLWGGSYTFIKLGVATIPPITLIAGRTSTAGALLLLVMYWRGIRLPRDAATWRRFMFQACLNSVVPWTLIAWGERAVDAGLATILNSTSPIFTFFLTLAVASQESPSLRKLFGVAVGMAGICLIVGVQAFAGLGEQLIAQIAIVVATICYAGAAVFGRGFKGLDPMAPAAGSLLCGAAVLIPVSIMVDRPWTLAPSTTSMLALLGLAVFSTAFAFVIYFRLIQTLGSVGTTAQSYLRAPIGVALGVLLLGERLSATAWIGLGCVVLGVAAMTIPPAQAARDRRSAARLSLPLPAGANSAILTASGAIGAPQERSERGAGP
ncbi:MAG TPA: EamA family transporter [Bradyrhizobium sp.]|nr:EamA family transporter [Bradyrhizobium sp.]